MKVAANTALMRYTIVEAMPTETKPSRTDTPTTILVPLTFPAPSKLLTRNETETDRPKVKAQ